MCIKNFQEDLKVKLNPNAFNFNKVHIGGTAIRVAVEDTFTTYTWENDILISRTPERVQDVGEVYAQIDKIRVAAKGDAADYLAALLEDGDALFFTGWMDTSFCEPVIVIERKSDIAHHKRCQK